MTVKEYLQYIEILDIFIASKKRERNEVLQDATSISSALGKEGAGSSGVSDKVGRYALKLSAIDEDIDRLVKDRERRINLIKSLDKPLEAKVLYKKYVEYAKYPSLSVIADELGYSHEHIRETHSNALKKLKIPNCI